MTELSPVELLMEERAINRLIDRWALGMDTKDWVMVEDCLAAQFTLLAPPLTSAVTMPRSEAMAAIEKRNADFGGYHCIPTKTIEIEGDTARVGARLIGGHWTDDRAAWEIGYGFYDLHLVREAGSWRLQALFLRLAFSQGPGIVSAMAASEAS